MCVAGLVGFAIEEATIRSCYSTSDVSGESKIGGLIGENTDEIEISDVISLDDIDSEKIFQVGIHGDSSSEITINTHLNNTIQISDISQTSVYDKIKGFMDKLSELSTNLGAVSNRLDSAGESTVTAMENTTSSLSTIRDADIAKESSAYIKAQILQQASATLLATANQSPAIALQLI